ncbi:hypothetical protein EXIGLDRAFT_398032 [Exidia glandulosa HHB12029]|uniref:Transcription factor domain-containing protein n=1 Tax=Exidia glandulosa HHB12029 TaxID=1314781 RepID=A0A165BN20_EXIGL|nr:hypothetical protein EXIGLDRAFT_398032 [Exidia glandulosa HHB12029]
MNAFRFPNASHAGPTPHNSLSGAGLGDEDEHNPECPCEWNRHLPQDVQMQLPREEHDAVLVEYFAYSVGWGVRVVRGRFMRDMRACLGGGEEGATAFYSPALHCAILADAGAFTPLVQGASVLGQPQIRASLASHARALAELELASSGRALVAAVMALAVLARYHLAQPRGARVAYGLFGMAARVASASGYGLDCGELVRRGEVSEEERWERDWCWASLGVQDVDISLHVGQDLSLSLSSSTARPSPPALLTSLPEADGIHFEIFLASLPLLSLARRLALPAPLTLPEVASLQTELAKWHADLPDALQLHRTSSSSAPPGIYMLHMCHWWITILLHRGFYGGGSGSGSEDSVKFIDDASRKILRALTTYDRLYTYRRAPLSAAQMAFVAGAAALMRADAAHAGALKKRREGLEAVGTAVNALRGMSLAWPCAAAYADALESRMPLVGRQERSPMPVMRHLSSGSISDHLPMSSQTLHTPNHSIGSVPVPAVVVNHNDGAADLAAQLQSLLNPFGGPAAMQIDFTPPSMQWGSQSPSPGPMDPFAPQPQSLGLGLYGQQDFSGGMSLDTASFAQDAYGGSPDAAAAAGVYASPTQVSPHSPQNVADPFAAGPYQQQHQHQHSGSMGQDQHQLYAHHQQSGSVGSQDQLYAGWGQQQQQ